MCMLYNTNVQLHVRSTTTSVQLLYMYMYIHVVHDVMQVYTQITLSIAKGS